MKTRLGAFLSMSAIILGALALAGTTARALPNGVYFLKCENGRCTCYNILGSAVGDYGGCFGDWTERIVIDVAAPNPTAPLITLAQDPCWGGNDALWWVGFLANLGPVSADSPNIDVAPLLELELPTLYCNEAHFNNVVTPLD